MRLLGEAKAVLGSARERDVYVRAASYAEYADIRAGVRAQVAADRETRRRRKRERESWAHNQQLERSEEGAQGRQRARNARKARKKAAARAAASAGDGDVEE